MGEKIGFTADRIHLIVPQRRTRPAKAAESAVDGVSRV
jgi:hypothetical protein